MGGAPVGADDQGSSPLVPGTFEQARAMGEAGGFHPARDTELRKDV